MAAPEEDWLTPREVDVDAAWDCAVVIVCDGTHQSDEKPFLIANDRYCAECIESYFEQACDSSMDSYPPKIGAIILNIDIFAHRLSDDVVRKFRRVDSQMKAAASYERVYCRWPSLVADAATGARCDVFVGRQLPKDAETTQVPCPQCERLVCGICGEGLQVGDTTHECKDLTTLEELLRSEQRGRGHQVCPKCKEYISLHDGCNHMTCRRCDCSFCFICGMEAAGTSDHWLTGGCPRYHHPDPREGDPRPLWDSVVPGSPEDPAAVEARRLLYTELGTRIYLCFSGNDEDSMDLRAGESRWRNLARLHKQICIDHNAARALHFDDRSLFNLNLEFETTFSAARLTAMMHDNAVGPQNDSELRFLRNLYLTHHAAKFRQNWNILLWQYWDQYGPTWEHFELFEHLRKLTLWAGVVSDQRQDRSSASLSFDSALVQQWLTLTRDDHTHGSADTDDNRPEAINERAVATLSQCLISLITALGCCKYRRSKGLLVAERMNVKYLYEELLDFYIDVVVDTIGLENFRESGEDQRQLCTLVEIMFVDVLSLGEDSIGVAFMESQAHIMSGRVYFYEMIKVIDLLRPQPPPPDEEPDVQSIEQAAALERRRAMITLRKAAALILSRANGDARMFDGTLELEELDGTCFELAQATLAAALDPDLEKRQLLLPILKHVHKVAARFTRIELEEFEDG